MGYLLDYCKVSGKRINYFEGIKKYVATGDIINNKIISFKDVTFDNKPSRANLKVENGEILFAKMMDTKKVLLIDSTNSDYIYSTGFYTIRVNKGVNPEYLYWFINSEMFNRQKDSFSSGATMKAINDKGLKQIELSNLPLEEEQIKRSKDLDNINELIENRKQQILDMKELISSKFNEMFSTAIIAGKNFLPLKDLVVSDRGGLKRGPFGGSLKKDDFVEDGFLVYEQRHAIHNDFEYKKYFIDQKKFDEMKMFAVKPGDLIVSCSGVTLGKIAEIPEYAQEGIINQALLKITLNHKIISNNFFTYIFRTKQVRESLFGLSRGTGIPNFPAMTELKKFRFFCPDIKLQEEFDEYFKIVEENQKIIFEDMQDLESLLYTKMHEYFD